MPCRAEMIQIKTSFRELRHTGTFPGMCHPAEHLVLKKEKLLPTNLFL
jgi:hypothetical protein